MATGTSSPGQASPGNASPGLTTVNVETLVNAGIISIWNVFVPVTIVTAQSSWELRGSAAQSVTVAFNARYRIVAVPARVSSANLIPGYAIPGMMIPGLDKNGNFATWSVRVGVSAARSSKFNLDQTRTAVKRIKWNVYNPVATAPIRQVNWRVRQLVTKSITADWEARQTETVTLKSRFNALFRKNVKQQSLFFTGTVRVFPAVNSAWNTRSLVAPAVRSSWKLPQRRVSTKLSIFHLNSSLVVLKNINFRLRDAVVAGPSSAAWNTRKPVVSSVTARFNDTTRHPVPQQAYWRVLKGLTKSQQAYWHLGIDPNGPVTLSVSSKFNVRQRLAVTSRKAAWVTIYRDPLGVASQFNLLVSVTVTAGFSWNIGPAVQSHIRQLAQERIDFAY